MSHADAALRHYGMRSSDVHDDDDVLLAHPTSCSNDKMADTLYFFFLANRTSSC